MEAVTQNQLPNLPSSAIENQRASHELPANMIPSKKGLATSKKLQNFSVSRHVDIEELKDFEVSLTDALAVYPALDPDSNYPEDRMQPGDELTITLLKPTIGTQEIPPPDEEHDFCVNSYPEVIRKMFSKLI